MTIRLYSYIVARDYGFAPNPFCGVCTLATCKPLIRGKAQIGDWVIGTGSKERGQAGRLVYAMRVSEALTFDQYWEDERFACKRPQLRGSLKQGYGDNIYRHGSDGGWKQVNSHHSLKDGSLNPLNVETDTMRPRVLISDDFTYWGGSGPVIPSELRNWDGSQDICHDRSGHRSNYSAEHIEAFVDWFRSLDEEGCVGEPERW
jgi:hypothetical protein